MMDEYLELNLVRKSIAGDPQAFRQLVESHQGLAYSIAFRFTRDSDESEDIVQEAFVNAWKNLSQYKSGFRFKTWISRIVVNRSLDYLKSGRKKKMLRENAVIVQEPLFYDNTLEAEELTSMVYKLAEGLTEKQKAVFILRDLELLSPEEVCEALQMKAGNMKSNLYYARVKIKEGLQEFYQIKKTNVS